jgi:hypothetical protein
MIGPTIASVSTLLMIVGRLQQACLFAADVRARTAMHKAARRPAVDFAHDRVVAENVVRVRLVNGALQRHRLLVIFPANVDVGSIELARVHADRDAFEHQVRIEIQQHAILERARLRLVSVHREVARLVVHRRKEAPLHPCRETRAAPATQLAGLDDVDHFRRLHRDGFLQPRVAVGTDELVKVDVLAILKLTKGRRGDALGQNWF